MATPSAVGAYRALMRARAKAFAGDARALDAAHREIRTQFERASDVDANDARAKIAAAVEEQRVSLLRIMLAHGASPARAKCGPLSPLYVACANAHVDDDFLDALREAGAPLMCAAFAQADGAQLDGRGGARGASPRAGFCERRGRRRGVERGFGELR